MAIPKEIANNLNPIILKDPTHITLISALKHLFDAPNFGDLTNTQAYNILDILCQQSRYGTKSDVFLNPKCRDLSKSAKLKILKDYYEFCKPKIMQIINNYESSFYCKLCYSKFEEDSGLFEAISNREYSYKDGSHSCGNFEPLTKFDTATKITCKGFLDEEFSFDLYPTGMGEFILVFNQDFNIFKKGYVVKVKDFKEIMRSWFKYVFTRKMKNVGTTTKLNTYSCDVSNISQPLDQNIEKMNTFFILSKLKCDGDEIAKAIEQLTSKASKKFSTIVGQERKIYSWIQSKGFDMPAHEFMRQYYPDSDPIEVLEMALREEKYSEAFERVQKDAEIGKCDLSQL